MMKSRYHKQRIFWRNDCKRKLRSPAKDRLLCHKKFVACLECNRGTNLCLRRMIKGFECALYWRKAPLQDIRVLETVVFDPAEEGSIAGSERYAGNNLPAVEINVIVLSLRL